MDFLAGNHLPRQHERDARSAPFFARDFDSSAVQFGDALDDRQAEPHSAGSGSSGAVHPVQPVEDVRQMSRADSATGFGNFDSQRSPIPHGHHIHPGVCTSQSLADLARNGPRSKARLPLPEYGFFVIEVWQYDWRLVSRGLLVVQIFPWDGDDYVIRLQTRRACGAVRFRLGV